MSNPGQVEGLCIVFERGNAEDFIWFTFVEGEFSR